jgi:hypothetical protein
MAEKKKAGFFRKLIDKGRKKIAPTFDEQFDKAKKSGKKTFRSTRDDKKKGNLEYSTKTKAEVKAEQKRMSNRERARVGDKSKQLSERGAKFKLAKKMGKDTFTHKGKKYSTLLKGEKKKKPLITGKGLIKKLIFLNLNSQAKLLRKLKKLLEESTKVSMESLLEKVA